MIVFCVLRKHCVVVAEVLKSLALNAFVYHDGMPPEQRAKVNSEFQGGGPRTVLVATSAYEMGVDVPGIRSVVHYGLPASLESFVQGIGRAGRDGRSATAILLYGDADLDILDSLERLGDKANAGRSASNDLINLSAQEVYAFAGTRTCRKALLRAHFHPEFGSAGIVRCDRCDNCDLLGPVAQRPTIQVAAVASELKKWRRQVAAAAGKPAFTVFSDRELNRIATHQPRDVVGLAKLTGIRLPNVDRYGHEVIELIRAVLNPLNCRI